MPTFQDNSTHSHETSEDGPPTQNPKSVMQILSLVGFLITLCLWLAVKNFQPHQNENSFDYRQAKALPVIGTLNLNVASYNQLRALPIISDQMAKNIIENRPFHRFEELGEIDGFDDRILELLQPHLKIENPKLTTEIQKFPHE